MGKQLRGNCQHCGETIEFPAEHTGESAPCPHCHAQTELLLPPPPREPSPFRTRAIVFFSVAALILIAGYIGAQLAIKRAQRLTGQRGGSPKSGFAGSPQATPGYQCSAVSLERATNGTLLYAVGTITESAQRRRFGVRVELALYGREGRPCGSAKDYVAALAAGDTWRFRALILQPQTARAEMVRITEDQ